jgi:hypothetical protein
MTEATFTSMEMSNQAADVTVSITRHYGQFSIEIGATVPCDLRGGEADRMRAIDEITDTLIKEQRRQRERIVSREAGGLPDKVNGQPKGESADKAEVPGTTQIIPVVAISVEEKSGRRKYRVHGGNFMRYGVVVYPQDDGVDFGVTGLQPEKLLIGNNKLAQPMRAVLSMAGTKPVKVLQMLPANVDI